MTSFLIVTDRDSVTPIILNIDQILSVWTAVDQEAKEVVGSNIFMLVSHGVGGEDMERRVCVSERPSQIAEAMALAGHDIGISKATEP